MANIFRTNPSVPFYKGSKWENPSAEIDKGMKAQQGGDDSLWKIKVWGSGSQPIPASDIALRKGAHRHMYRPLGSLRLRPQYSPIIAYETFLFDRLSDAEKKGTPIDIDTVHHEALRKASEGLSDYSNQELKESAYREIDRLRDRTHLEESMAEIIGPRDTNVAGSLNGYGVGTRPKAPASGNYEYSEYIDADGNKVSFRSAAKANGKLRLDFRNLFFHVVSELVRGGNPAAPMAAAKIVLKSSDNQAVCTFSDFVSASEDEEGPEPEVEFG